MPLPSKDSPTKPTLLVNSNNLLEFTSLQTSDSGKYACTLEDEQDQESDWIEVRVDEYEPISIEISTKFDTDQDDDSKTANKEIVLMCWSLKGKPQPTIKWFRDNDNEIYEKIGTIRVNEFGSELTLKPDHARGVFKCVARNNIEEKVVYTNTGEPLRIRLLLNCRNNNFFV